MTGAPEKQPETPEDPGCEQPGSRVIAPSPHPAAKPAKRADAFARAENEDDDGYDPWSDRPPHRDPLFERDPWS